MGMPKSIMAASMTAPSTPSAIRKIEPLMSAISCRDT